MAYIEAHQSLRDHRKVLALSAELDMPEPHVAGHCMFLWLWSLDNAEDGVLPASERIIERAAGWVGAAGALVARMVRVGLVDRDETGALHIHDWFDYARFVERVERHPVRVEWEGMRPKVVAYLLDRDGYRCQECGTTAGPLEIDHIVPSARGGQNEPGNLQVLCWTCNRRKGAS